MVVPLTVGCSLARAVAIVAITGALGSGAAPAGTLKVPCGVTPPPLSRPLANYYETHPAEWRKLVQRLPKMRELPPQAHSGTPPSHCGPG